ncbi:L,D-transpeptidase [Paludibacterium purpuratum]|uniref:L,D-transpeptidase-like protein n=1 Tax=Paludibacterium purpuratum TaxID=1144873 RepID=A0A4R7BGQ8_9NEIS|nr:L,D-transpeptidase [Paludibacterium purpuratum]TDR82916.1 L,D-transpeptidase-like protein [Paludibacterium purpuratum]
MSKFVASILLATICLTARAGLPEPDVLVVEHGRQVVINVPQTRLFLYQDGKLVKSWPVAVGKMLTGTPTGSFDITGIYHDPTWHVPKSIQAEMRAQGKPVLTAVPPGDDNPLGKVFIRFGEPGLGLGMHGTNAPGSVPGFRSHGCVRLKNPDALDLAGLVSVGDAVTVAYQAILLNQDPAGNLWLTAYRNPYGHDDVSMPWLAQVLLKWQRDHKVAIFGQRVDESLHLRNGKPVCLTCQGSAPDYRNVGLTVYRWLSNPPDSTLPGDSSASQGRPPASESLPPQI